VIEAEQAWRAQLIVIGPDVGEPEVLRSTRWASCGEARAFIERHLPLATTTVTAQFEVRGRVMPAKTSVSIDGDRMVEDVAADETRAEQAAFDHGRIWWSARDGRPI
jgi:hypothetical protein